MRRPDGGVSRPSADTHVFFSLNAKWDGCFSYERRHFFGHVVIVLYLCSDSAYGAAGFIDIYSLY